MEVFCGGVLWKEIVKDLGRGFMEANCGGDLGKFLWRDFVEGFLWKQIMKRICGGIFVEGFYGGKKWRCLRSQWKIKIKLTRLLLCM